MREKPSALVFYHYLYPDVVSAVLMGELCQGLVERGWQVTARPCNRGCRVEGRTYPSSEDWNGVRIKRVKRPRFRQSSFLGRSINILWMLAAWSFDALRTWPTPNVIVIGTDPVLSVLVAIVWKALRPGTRIAHWCFDLYPEAAFADGLLHRDGLMGRFLRALLRRAYRCCDLIADVGSCMRAQLESYDTKALVVTLVPWALEEPAEPVPISEHERSNVFGTASLGLMYSGSYGRAHACSDLLTLSRSLLLSDAVLAFSVRGNRVEELKRSIALGDSNIRLVPFATPDKLQERLSAADIHLVSLRDEWTGMVVPSKFFGALAIGRPVLFFGSRKSSVAELIEKHRIGWVWDPENTSRNICGLASDPQQMAALSRHCHAVYRAHFSRDRILNKWDQHLRQILEVMPPN